MARRDPEGYVTTHYEGFMEKTEGDKVAAAILTLTLVLSEIEVERREDAAKQDVKKTK